MRLNITDINRINTCGYLKQNNWDYQTEEVSNPSFFAGMKEVLKWHYRRNGPVDPESFMTFLSGYNHRAQVKHEDRIAIEAAFREFVSSNFYQNLTKIYINYLTDIKISKDDYLENDIPVFQNLNERPTFIYIQDKLIPRELFMQRFDIMHNSVWSFYNLNRNPTFMRIWFDGESIKRETFKADDDYILQAKRHLITIGKNVNMFVLPTIQTCMNCSKLAVCDRYSNKRLKKRGKNVETA